MSTPTSRRTLRRLWVEESGAQALEFVAILPMVLFVLLLMLQVAALAYTVVVAEAAARDAAVAAAGDSALIKEWLGAHPSKKDFAPANTRVELIARESAASIPVQVPAVECDQGKVTLELKATTPNLLLQKPIEFTRKVVMPTLQGGCP